MLTSTLQRVGKGARPKCPCSISMTEMTLTERNQRLYELRHKLNMKRAEVKMVEGEMNRVRDEYERAQFDIPGNSLYDQMFGG